MIKSRPSLADFKIYSNQEFVCTGADLNEASKNLTISFPNGLEPVEGPEFLMVETFGSAQASTPDVLNAAMMYAFLLFPTLEELKRVHTKPRTPAEQSGSSKGLK